MGRLKAPRTSICGQHAGARMSFELVLLCTSADATEADRKNQIGRAIAAIPEVSDVSTVCRGQVIVALARRGSGHGGSPIWVTHLAEDTLAGFALNDTAKTRVVADRGRNLAKSGCEGAAILVRISPDGHSVTMENDGLAFIPLFYAYDGAAGLTASTSLHALVASGVPTQWDLAGVIQYLACLHPLGHRTLLQAAQVLPPGAILKWRRGKIELSSAPLLNPPDVPESSTQSIGELVEEFGGIWRRVISRMARRCSGRVIQGLSGGLDSRGILVGLSDIGVRPLSFTYGSRNGDEVEIASRVADVLEVPHLRLSVYQANVLAGFEEAINALDGTHSLMELYEHFFGKELSSIGDTFVSGESGDVFWGSDRANGVSDVPALRQMLMRRYTPDLAALSSFLVPDLRRKAMNILGQGIEESCAFLRGQSRLDISTFWNLRNRQTRWGFALNNVIRRLGLQYEDPFFDSELIAFMRRVPPHLRLHGRLYLEVHRRVFARTSHIARSAGAPAPALPQDFLYLTHARSSLSQVLELLRRYPLAGMYRVRHFAGRRGLLALAARLCHRHDIQATHRFVSPLEVLVQNNPTCRKRFVDLLEEATSYAPEFVDRQALLTAQSAVKKGTATSDPLLLGRIVSICFWHKLWTTNPMR